MKKRISLATVFVLAILVGWLVFAKQETVQLKVAANSEQCIDKIGEQIWIPGGTFTMGDTNFYREEGPCIK